MADEIGRVCGPAEAAGYERFVDFVSQLYRLEMKDFIDRNIDSPFDLLTPEPGAAGGDGRLPPAGAEDRGVPQGPPDPADLLLPVAVRRTQPARRLRDLLDHRLHGLRRRGLLPRGRHARRAPRPGRRGREARRGHPLLHRGGPRRDARRSRRGRPHRRRRAHRVRRRRAQPRPPGGTPRPARPAGSAAVALLPVLRAAARRVLRRLLQDRPPQHPLRGVVARGVPRPRRHRGAAERTPPSSSPTRPAATPRWPRTASRSTTCCS